jgi:hypothetical protein
MPIELPVIIVIAVVALVAAATVAQRAGEHADRKAGRPPAPGGPRRGPIGALLDLLDESVAAYMVRSRLGRSTLTRPERQTEEQRASAMARADEIRRLKMGAPPPHAPKRLIVAGSATAQAAAAPPVRSTLSVELLAAALGLAVVILVVIGIWPRESGAVLSATGTPAPSAVVSPSPSVLPTVPP